MGEYKIITGTDSDCQMKLNQWKHQYNLDILQMSVRASDGFVVILLVRHKK